MKTKDNTETKVRVDLIDGSHCPWVDGLDADHVDDIAEGYAAGQKIEPLVVWSIGQPDGNPNRYYVSSGFHRLAAAIKAELKEVDCYVRTGTMQDCLTHAHSAFSNPWEVRRRTRKDKQNAVDYYLRTYPNWTDGRIAEQAGVTDKTVAARRTSGIPEVKSAEPNTAPQRRVGRDGKSYATRPSSAIPQIGKEETVVLGEPTLPVTSGIPEVKPVAKPAKPAEVYTDPWDDEESTSGIPEVTVVGEDYAKPTVVVAPKTPAPVEPIQLPEVSDDPADWTPQQLCMDMKKVAVQITEVLTRVVSWESSKYHHTIATPQLRGWLTRAKDTVLQNQPTHPCSYCGGKGLFKGLKCAICRGTNRITSESFKGGKFQAEAQASLGQK